AAAIETAFAALAFTITLALFHRREPNGGVELGRVAWVALTLGSGVLVGMLFLSLIRLRADELGLALLGTVLFGAGAAYAAGSSPFIVCAIAAALIVNRAPMRRAVGEAVLTTVVVGVILAQLVATPLLAWSFRRPALTAPQPAADLS